MIDWPTVQTRLGVKADGNAGPITYAALLTKVAGKTPPLAPQIALGFVVNASPYGIDANGDRMAAFLGQTAMETGGFVYMQEQGSDAYFTRRYENSAALGNTQPGDGARFHGRGLIQLTGRLNYRAFGRAIGLDLISDPDIAAQPSTAVLIALEYWKENGLNAYADRRDIQGITRRINGATNGLAQRVAYTNIAARLFA